MSNSLLTVVGIFGFAAKTAFSESRMQDQSNLDDDTDCKRRDESLESGPTPTGWLVASF